MPNEHAECLMALSDAELDLVSAAAPMPKQGSLVNLNNLVSINVGVGIANQSNVAVFSTATQGGAQFVNLSQLSLISL